VQDKEAHQQIHLRFSRIFWANHAQGEMKKSRSAPRQACELQAIAEAGHKLRREGPCLAGFGNRKVRVLAHELPPHSPRLAASPRQRRSSDRHALRPE
jgi:hypothetical protein